MINQYAYDRSENLIDINDVNPNNRYHHAPFQCIECHSELIPKLGNQVEWHFAHKNLGNCNGESYLHKLAKLVFFDTYKKCLFNNTPFFIDYVINHYCSKFDNLFPEFNCFSGEQRKYNLIDLFDKIDLEGACGIFRADILLSSSKSSKKIMVEITVSHQCTLEKLASGIPIIEMGIRKEAEIEHLKCTDLGLISKVIGVKKHNFKRNDKRAIQCDGNCLRHEKIFAFVVYRNLKQYLGKFNPLKLAKAIIAEDAIFVRRFDEYSFEKNQEMYWKEIIQQARMENLPVTNCRNCANHRQFQAYGRTYHECVLYHGKNLSPRAAESCSEFTCSIQQPKTNKRTTSNKFPSRYTKVLVISPCK